MDEMMSYPKPATRLLLESLPPAPELVLGVLPAGEPASAEGEALGVYASLADFDGLRGGSVRVDLLAPTLRGKLAVFSGSSLPGVPTDWDDGRTMPSAVTVLVPVDHPAVEAACQLRTGHGAVLSCRHGWLWSEAGTTGRHASALRQPTPPDEEGTLFV